SDIVASPHRRQLAQETHRWRRGSAPTRSERAEAERGSVAEDCQVGLPGPFGVGDDVDLDDPPAAESSSVAKKTTRRGYTSRRGAARSAYTARRERDPSSHPGDART